MEIAKNTAGSIKIKSKNATFIVDPASPSDADAVLLLTEKNFGELGGDQLVIEGAGEYETKGIVVKGEGQAEKLRYEIEDSPVKMLLTTSDALGGIKDVDEYVALVVKVNGKVDEADLPALASGYVVLFGNVSEAGLPNIKQAPKVNLKKIDPELQGSIISL